MTDKTLFQKVTEGDTASLELLEHEAMFAARKNDNPIEGMCEGIEYNANLHNESLYDTIYTAIICGMMYVENRQIGLVDRLCHGVNTKYADERLTIKKENSENEQSEQ